MDSKIDVHQLVKNTYDKVAVKYFGHYSKRSPLFLKFSELFIKELPKKGKILDLGCGPGKDAKFFSERGFKVTGVDFSEGMLKIAQKNNPSMEFVKCDLRKISFDRNSYDGIWCFFFLLHLKKDEAKRFLEKVYQILKPNGMMVLATKQGEGEIIEKEVLDSSLQMYENFWSKDELENLVKNVGLKIIETDEGYERYDGDEKVFAILARK